MIGPSLFVVSKLFLVVGRCDRAIIISMYSNCFYLSFLTFFHE